MEKEQKRHLCLQCGKTALQIQPELEQGRKILKCSNCQEKIPVDTYLMGMQIFSKNMAINALRKFMKNGEYLKTQTGQGVIIVGFDQGGQFMVSTMDNDQAEGMENDNESEKEQEQQDGWKYELKWLKQDQLNNIKFITTKDLLDIYRPGQDLDPNLDKGDLFLNFLISINADTIGYNTFDYDLNEQFQIYYNPFRRKTDRNTVYNIQTLIQYLQKNNFTGQLKPLEQFRDKIKPGFNELIFREFGTYEVSFVQLSDNTLNNEGMLITEQEFSELGNIPIEEVYRYIDEKVLPIHQVNIKSKGPKCLFNIQDLLDLKKQNVLKPFKTKNLKDFLEEYKNQEQENISISLTKHFEERMNNKNLEIVEYLYNGILYVKNRRTKKRFNKK